MFDLGSLFSPLQKASTLYGGGLLFYNVPCMDVNIKLPALHDKQQQIRNSNAKRKVVCAGRRGGKTTLLAALSVEWFLNGHRIVYGTPVAKQLKAYWGEVKKHLKPLIQGGYIYKNETDHTLYWAHEGEGGAAISAQTAFNADTWRGDWGDKLIFDEFAYMHPEVWQKVGVPMLLDNDGEAWFISTPNRKNHFHALYVRGMDTLDGRWQSFKFTSHDNPYLSQDALGEITFDMTEDDYQQEIMAEFLENEGAVFRNIGANLNAQHTRPQDHAGHHLIAGVDWGKHQDYTVISVGCNDCKQEVYLDRFNQIDYAFQRGRLAEIERVWGRGLPFLPERNSIGEPNIDQLLHDGFVVLNGPDGKPGYMTTATSKPPLIENFKLSLERVEFQFLPDPIAAAELEAYEVKISERTGRPFYSAPPGVHDDTVIARALMLQAINSYMRAFL